MLCELTDTLHHVSEKRGIKNRPAGVRGPAGGPWRATARRASPYTAADRHVNPADGVESLTNGPRTHPTHAEGRLEYKGAEPGRPKWNLQNRLFAIRL